MDSLDFYGILALQMNITLPTGSSSSAPPAPNPAAPLMPATQTAPRWKSRYGVAYCTICDMAAEYCKGHVQDAQSPDGAESQLRLRIAEVVGKRAGR